MAQGGAYIGNLIGGTLRLEPVMDRSTPYHAPHSTRVAGFAVTYGADDRWWGNIFIGNGGDPADISAAYAHTFRASTLIRYGTAGYDGCPTSMADYIARVEANLPGDLGAFQTVRQPAYLHHNVYLHAASQFEAETDALADAADPGLAVEPSRDGLTLRITLPDGFAAHRFTGPSPSDLGRVRLVDADFEEPDGTPLRLGTDLAGHTMPAERPAGPLASLTSGDNRIRLPNRGQQRYRLDESGR